MFNSPGSLNAVSHAAIAAQKHVNASRRSYVAGCVAVFMFVWEFSLAEVGTEFILTTGDYEWRGSVDLGSEAVGTKERRRALSYEAIANVELRRRSMVTGELVGKPKPLYMFFAATPDTTMSAELWADYAAKGKNYYVEHLLHIHESTRKNGETVTDSERYYAVMLWSFWEQHLLDEACRDGIDTYAKRSPGRRYMLQALKKWLEVCSNA